MSNYRGRPKQAEPLSTSCFGRLPAIAHDLLLLPLCPPLRRPLLHCSELRRGTRLGGASTRPRTTELQTQHLVAAHCCLLPLQPGSIPLTILLSSANWVVKPSKSTHHVFRTRQWRRHRRAQGPKLRLSSPDILLAEAQLLRQEGGHERAALQANSQPHCPRQTS